MSLTRTLEIFQKYQGFYLGGLLMTIYISIISTILGGLIGLLVGVVRTIPKPDKKNFKYYLLFFVNTLLNIYVEFFRATPMMVQAMVVYYGLSGYFGFPLDRTVAALFIVSINTGAYMSEIVRGGILSIDKGQFEAARAIGMNHIKTMRYVVLPQVVRNIIPATGNEFIVNLKDTSVLNVIGVSELYYSTSSVNAATFMTFEAFSIAIVLYLVMTLTITAVLRKLEKKMDGNKNYNLIANQMQVTKL